LFPQGELDTKENAAKKRSAGELTAETKPVVPKKARGVPLSELMRYPTAQERQAEFASRMSDLISGDDAGDSHESPAPKGLEQLGKRPRAGPGAEALEAAEALDSAIAAAGRGGEAGSWTPLELPSADMLAAMPPEALEEYAGAAGSLGGRLLGAMSELLRHGPGGASSGDLHPEHLMEPARGRGGRATRGREKAQGGAEARPRLEQVVRERVGAELQRADAEVDGLGDEDRALGAAGGIGAEDVAGEKLTWEAVEAVAQGGAVL